MFTRLLSVLLFGFAFAVCAGPAIGCDLLDRMAARRVARRAAASTVYVPTSSTVTTRTTTYQPVQPVTTRTTTYTTIQRPVAPVQQRTTVTIQHGCPNGACP